MLKYGGFVNKFQGDAALCVFGAPIEHPDASGAALASARELHDELGQVLTGLDLEISWVARRSVADPEVTASTWAPSRFIRKTLGF